MRTHAHTLVVVAALAAAFTAVGAAGCSTTRSAEGQLDDAAVTSKVKSKLAADPQVNPFNIDVDTTEGVVRLSGMVEDTEARSEAEKLARDTAGVRGVVNEIEIGDPTVGEVVDDAWIVTKVKAQLTANEDINPFNVDVDAQQGVVTLSGRVQNVRERELAENIAAGVKGVRRVDNRLSVGAIDG